METIRSYYARRAKEYEEIYRKPERQGDLRELEAMLGAAFSGMDVLEIACGTGYWTQFIARSAHSVHAVDVNPRTYSFWPSGPKIFLNTSTAGPP